MKRIRVLGKRSPVELYALIFATNTIIPQAILPTLPKVWFELVPEEPTHANTTAEAEGKIPTTAVRPPG